MIELTVKRMKESAEFLRGHFDNPQDDWPPFLYMQKGDECEVLPLIFDDNPMKSLVANVIIPMAIKVYKAETIGMLLSAWMTVENIKEGEIPKSMEVVEEEYRRVPPSQRKDKIEALILTAMNKDGEVQIWWAEIKRKKKKLPKLGEWQKMEGESDQGGQFIEGARKALMGED